MLLPILISVVALNPLTYSLCSVITKSLRLRQAKFPGEKEPLLDNAVVERLSALDFTKRNLINM